MPPPFSMWVVVVVGGGGGHIVSPSVRTYVHPWVPSVRPVRNTNGFRAISFERLSVLD